MSKITIIEGNSNDKDNVRNFIVKGEKGDPGVSPTFAISKENGTATIVITDAEGTHSVQISDGELTKAMVIDNLTSTNTDLPLSAKQGKHLKSLVDNTYTKDEVDDMVTAKFDADNFAAVWETWDTTGNKTLDYPDGFTKDNCVVASIMWDNETVRRTFIGGDIGIQVTLTSSAISVTNTYAEGTIYVVLMKFTFGVG